MQLKEITTHSALVALFLATLASAENMFEYKSFSIHSQVKISLQTFSAYEMYSPEQSRAVIKMTSNSRRQTEHEGEGELYLDRHEGTSILFNQTTHKCEAADPLVFLKLLKLDVITDNLETNDLIVGPFRLVLYMNQFYKSFEYVGASNAYEFDKSIDGIGQVSFSIHYATKDPIDGYSIPKRIVIYVPTLYFVTEIISVEYSRLEHDIETKTLIDNEIASMMNVARLDPFAIRRVANCGAAIGDKSKNIFEGLPVEGIKFSFLGRIYSSNWQTPLDISVTYDSRIASMRIGSEQDNEYFTKLIQFKSNEIYHSVKRNINRDSGNLIIGDNQDDIKEVNSCSVARMFQDPMVISSLSVSKLLVGSDKFVYRGKANVEGIDALVYEASDSLKPFWLDQYIAYETNEGTLGVREPGQRIEFLKSSDVAKYQTLLYVRDSLDGSPVPIMMEIIRLSENNAIISSQTVMFNDFIWDLEEQHYNGIKLVDSFSVQELCSSPEDQFGRIDIQLESEYLNDKQMNALKLRSSVRNLELMSAIQDNLKLPATMIYDMNSRIYSQGSQDQRQIIQATFRVAEHRSVINKLIYLGRGVMDYSMAQKRVSLVDCFLMAAERNESFKFAYDLDSNLCAIASHDSYILLNKLGPIEVFQGVTEPYDTRKDSTKISWLRRISHTKDGIQFLNKKIDLFTDLKSSEVDKSTFTIKSLRVEPLNKDSATISTQSKSDEELISKILGFGLSPGDRNSRAITAKSLDSNSLSNGNAGSLNIPETEMDFERCRIACLKDLDCKSFSICLKNSRMICSLTSSDLNFSLLNKKLQEKSIEELRQDVTFKLDSLDNDMVPIELIKHRSCELYNKLYMDMFELPITIRQIPMNRPVYQVRSREECAKKCFQVTMNILATDVTQTKRHIPYSSLDMNLADTSFENALINHREYLRSICREFFFISKLEMEQQPNDVRNNLLIETIYDDVPQNQVAGYCITRPRTKTTATNKTETTQESEPNLVESKYVNMEKYLFRFELLYERKFGVSLKASEMTPIEANAYSWLKSSVKTGDSSDAVENLKDFMENGNNFQESIVASAAKCALVCFTQSWGPWPSCQSFDILVKDKDSGKTQLLCHLNSVTMQSVIKNNRWDLIDDKNANDIMVWHFDPRTDFVKQESVLHGLWAFYEQIFHQDANVYLIQPVFVLLIAVASIFSGIFVGLKIGQVGYSKYNRMQEDEQKSLSNRLTIEFKNQVRHDKTIPG